ncbi:MAG: ABC transporter ATP-binding protein [Planctomycetes bacterium]|nr:ABC transporter ATP-binding protein [Planctomycetota bacterium]
MSADPGGSPRASDAAILATDLGRQFDGRWAVRHLHLAVQPGEIYGFLGQNGAGKTTTIRMLAGLLRPSAGVVRIGGHDLHSDRRAVQQCLGVVLDTPPLYDHLTGRQHGALVGNLWGVPRELRDRRLAALCDALQLTEQLDEPCRSYSHGTRKKVHLAAVLATNPRVLLLDEPTTGLDPLSVRRLKDLLRAESQRGTAILCSTHVLETAEVLCHRLGILHGGTLRAEGLPAELRAAAGGASLEDVFLQATAAPIEPRADDPAAR